MMKKLVLTFVLLNACSWVVFGQESTFVPLNSNRVGYLESTRTVGKGGLMVETGFQYDYTAYMYDVPPNQLEYTINQFRGPRLRLSYGVSRSMEINLEYDKLDMNYVPKAVSGENYQISEYIVGLKFNLTEQNKVVPELAVRLTERIYSGAELNETFETRGNISWRYKLGSNFRISGNVVLSFSSLYLDDVDLGVKMGYQFNEKFNAYTEWYRIDNDYYHYAVNVGAWYRPYSRVLTSLSIGTNSFNSWNVDRELVSVSTAFGVSFLLKNPNENN